MADKQTVKLRWSVLIDDIRQPCTIHDWKEGGIVTVKLRDGTLCTTYIVNVVCQPCII